MDEKNTPIPYEIKKIYSLGGKFVVDFQNVFDYLYLTSKVEDKFEKEVLIDNAAPLIVRTVVVFDEDPTLNKNATSTIEDFDISSLFGSLPSEGYEHTGINVSTSSSLTLDEVTTYIKDISEEIIAQYKDLREQVNKMPDKNEISKEGYFKDTTKENSRLMSGLYEIIEEIFEDELGFEVITMDKRLLIRN